MPPQELPVIGVAELCRRLKFAVERVVPAEWVEGEVSSLKRAPSGHVYFALKDETKDAVVDCVIYKFYAQRSGRLLHEGARVQLRGQATVYAPRGRLQFVAERVRQAGRGALLEALEKLKEKLRAEGLFAAERKRPLPAECRVIGVVTSGSGAAFHDICSVAFRRGAVHVVLSPATVQGDVAVKSLIRAIDAIERYPGLDVLIIGRGGGSLEDLQAFNDEALVRRIARVKVPVVSAVGHEVDTTLTDWVADVRAATPSQAAELVVPDDVHRREALLRCAAALGRAARARLWEGRSRTDRLRAALSDPRFLMADRQQELDELYNRLERSLGRHLAARRDGVDRMRERLLERHPRLAIARGRGAMGPLSARLRSAVRMRLERGGARLSREVAKLDDLSPLAVLGRGYAIVTREDGTAVRRAAEVHVGEQVAVRVHSGRLACAVTAVDESEVAAPARSETGSAADVTSQGARGAAETGGGVPSSGAGAVAAARSQGSENGAGQ